MTDGEKTAGINAEYLPVIKELIATKTPLADFAALLVAGASVQGIRAEAVGIEKITPITPEPRRPVTLVPPSAAAVEVIRPPASAPPVIHLPHLVTSPIGYPFVFRSTVTSSSGKQTVIGQDFETGADIAVGDIDRCGGFYVLGQPRTGKSNLLVSMALQDIKNGHGLLFIDPHTEAINKLIARIPKERHKDVVYLDPTRNDRSFGINLLHCKNSRNPLELERTTGRVRDIFAKVWGDDRGELGVWLYKVITNSVYILLENEGYTLADVPLLLWKDTTFRNKLLENVTTTSVRDFWYEEFDRLTERDKTDQVGPAISRLDILMGSPILKDIVGQKDSTIDFAEILDTRKIVLLRIPANLDRSVKNLIGTITVSELLYEVFERAERIGKDDMPYFGIYCDEFQEFATPDFAKLFTQTGKFRAMPVVAHQTREQFKPGDPNRGATAASPNKLFFTLSQIDAREMPLEFAKEPPSETRLEEQLVISQNPVRDLLHGHNNKEIRDFVNKYLGRLEDKREDRKADMEGAKFARMIELDTAAFFGAEAQEEGVVGGSHISSQIGAIHARQCAILNARMHSIKLDALHKHSNRIRVTMRGLNRFLTEVMEGDRRAGQEAFADFLINLAASYSAFPEAYAEVLGLYIKLSYGDPSKHRQIPFDLARSQGLFSGEVAALTFNAQKKTEEERRAFRARFIPEEEQERADRRMREREQKIGDTQRAMEGKIASAKNRRGAIRVGKTGSRAHHPICHEDLIWYPPNVYTWYIWLRVFPDIEKLVIPYRTATFNGTCEYLMDDGEAAKTIAKLDESLKLVKYPGYGFEAYMEYMRPTVVRDIKEFLHRYQEGALVMLALLDCAGKGGWQGRQDGSISVSEFPGIEGKDPIDTWCLVERLRVLMHTALGDTGFSSVFAKYLDSYRYSDLDDRLYHRGFQTSIPSYTMCDDIRYRDDVQSLEKLVKERWNWFVRNHPAAGEWWKKLSALVRCYVLCRAADMISFGERYSSLPPAAFAPYEELVGALVALSKDTKARHDAAEEKEEAVRERQRIEEECAEKVGRISHSPPAVLEARVLDAAQIRAVRDVCIKVIKDGPKDVYETAATIDEFARFCVLLAQPENHIKVRSTQYVEKPVRPRTEIDMVNEMAREFVNLPKYTAYARVVGEKDGKAIVWKGKVRTLELPGVAADAFYVASEAIQRNALPFSKPREEIRKEIEKRQEPWRRRVRVEAPSVRIAEKKARSSEQSVPGPEEPMPPKYVTPD
jgi:hypothetical protein